MIERSIGFYHQYLERRGIASRQLQDFLAPYFNATETQTPAYAETIKGMAEGAMVPVWELFAVNAFEELEPLLGTGPEHPSFIQTDAGSAPTRRARPQPDRCSTFAVSGPGFTLLGHNEQWLAGDGEPESPRRSETAGCKLSVGVVVGIRDQVHAVGHLGAIGPQGS